MATQPKYSRNQGALSRISSYFTENSRSLIIISSAVVVLVLGFFAYLKFYKQPREREATELMWKAQYYFEKDSFNLAINGTSQHPGFLHIANEYSGTNAGDLARYYLGISYLNTGQYDLAVNALEGLEFDDQQVSCIAIGSCGDAYLELGQTQEAIAKYEAAARKNVNEFTTPLYLKKAALAYEDLGNYAKAAEYYQRIADEFEQSAEAADIEKYLYRAKNKASR